MRVWIARFAAWAATAWLLAAPAGAQEAVDLELVLLADATGSIDQAEIEFQREGYAVAITDPSVVHAMTSGPLGRVAVVYVEWADAASQQVVADWTVIDGPEAAARFAGALLGPPRQAYGRNAIGAALLFGKALIEGNAYDGTRKVLDLSADSANNWNGPSIEEARAEVLADGISINGLAVLCRSCSGRPISYDLEQAFADRIIGGPVSFVVTADDAASFANAVRRKLLLEVSGVTPEAPVRHADAGSLSERRPPR
ncbi:MAG: DUF1194 domain-containing protein [Pseudomonadota bacterium]